MYICAVQTFWHLAVVFSTCSAHVQHMKSTATPGRIMRGKNLKIITAMKEKALKVLKIILKFLPMLINILDDLGDKVQVHIDRSHENDHIV